MITSTEEFINFIKNGEKNALGILKEFSLNNDEGKEVTD